MGDMQTQLVLAQNQHAFIQDATKGTPLETVLTNLQGRTRKAVCRYRNKVAT